MVRRPLELHEPLARDPVAPRSAKPKASPADGEPGSPRRLPVGVELRCWSRLQSPRCKCQFWAICFIDFNVPVSPQHPQQGSPCFSKGMWRLMMFKPWRNTARRQ